MSSTQASNPVSTLMSSSRGRWQVLTIAAVVVVSVSVWFNLPQTVETCDLIEGYTLRKNDLQRIQVALGKARLNDFEIVENRICVPKGQRSAYLQAVVDGNALPQGLAPDSEDSQSFNPLLSRTQQEQVRQTEKKKQVTEMVEMLRFVEQAWFEMDRVESRSSFEKGEQTAVIMIQPSDELQLDAQQIDTIRDVIKGAYAGIDRQSIVVTDLNRGSSYQTSEFDGSQVVESSAPAQLQLASHREKQQIRYENSIREALHEFDGIQVKVVLESVTVEPDKVDRQARRSNAKPSIIKIGTNGQAALSETQLPKAESKGRYVEKFNVEISISDQQLPKRVAPMVRSVGPSTKNTTYQPKIEEFKAEIVQRVLQVLPTSKVPQAQHQVQVTVVEEPVDQTAVASPLEWLNESLEPVGGPWGGGAILLLGVMMIAYVFSGSRRTATDSQIPVSSSTEELLPEMDLPPGDEQSIKSEISKLIHEDPEAAAKVIKRWIRNAA